MGRMQIKVRLFGDYIASVINLKYPARTNKTKHLFLQILRWEILCGGQPVASPVSCRFLLLSL